MTLSHWKTRKRLWLRGDGTTTLRALIKHRRGELRRNMQPPWRFLHNAQLTTDQWRRNGDTLSSTTVPAIHSANALRSLTNKGRVNCNSRTAVLEAYL
jgi:hypothetical protein